MAAKSSTTSSGKSAKPPRRREPPAHKAGREEKGPKVPRVEPTMPDAPGARRIVVASWVGTALLALTAVPATIAPDPFAVAAVVASLVLFFAGVIVFAWAYLTAIGRSRTDLIGMGGLFFLAGSAPRSVQRQLLTSFAVEVVVGIATASAWLIVPDHFSEATVNPLAFGLLAPMYGLGVMGLWAARYGTFPPRPQDEPRPARSRKQSE